MNDLLEKQSQPISGYRFDEAEHLHTFEGKALTGTSSVSDVLAKPLTWWASGLAVKEFGVTDPKLLTKVKNKTATDEEIAELMNSIEKKHAEIKDMTSAEFFGLVDGAYRAHASNLKEKAQDGTDMHQLLEDYVKECLKNEGKPFMPEHCDPRVGLFAIWSMERVKRFLWSEMHCFSVIHWLGGISDCGFEDFYGKVGIIDFKSSKEAYLSQFWQCAGYDIQITENGGYNADGKKTFTLEKPIDYYVVFPFGMEEPKAQTYDNVEDAKKAFLAEVTLYRLMPRN